MRGINVSIEIAGTSFHPSNINSITQATDRDHIGNVFSRAWDAVADWFCGTHQSEAKKCLFDLYSNTATDAEKIASFVQLRDYAGEGYKDRFVRTEENGRLTYKVDLGLGDEAVNFSLKFRNLGSGSEPISFGSVADGQRTADKRYITEQLMADRTTEDLVDILRKDLSRGAFFVDGKKLDTTALTEDEAITHFDQLVADLHCTEAQKNKIIETCNQSLFGIMLNPQCLGLSLGNGLGPNSPGLAEVLRYDISQIGKEGESSQIRVQAHCIKDIAVDSDHELLQTKVAMVKDNPDFMFSSLNLQIDLRIDSNGTVTVAELNGYVNEGTGE